MTTQSLFSLWYFNCGTNTAPVVTDEWVSVRSGKTFSTTASTLLSNDKDANGDALSISAYGKPAHGTLSVNCGNLSYCPTPGFVGTDTFTYTVSDGHGGKTTATVHINVLPPVQPPAITGAHDDAGTQTGNVATGGSTDDLRPTLSGTAEAGAKVVVYDGTTKLGTVTADASGKWSLTPASDLAQGAHHFSVSATGTDGTKLGTSAAYDLNCVIDTNHPPVVANETASVRAGGSLVTSVSALLANDSDPDGNTLSITSLGTPAHGSLVRAADGSITYTPEAGYTGGDSYTYVVSDGKGGTATGTVQITVKAAMAAPVITDVVDDAGTNTGVVASGGRTDDSLPLLHGTAEAGAGVDVLANGVVIGHVVADTNGLWSFQVGTALGQGPQQFTAQATAADGAKATSAGYDITLAADPVPDTHADAPTVSISTDANDNGSINRAELGSATTATVRLGLPADAQAGDVVSLTDGSHPQSHALTDADIAAGHWDATVALPAEGATLQISATITDGLGNVSVPGTDAAVLDTQVANPVVTILADGNDDAYLNAAEVAGAPSLAVKVAFDPAGVNEGDVVHFSANGVPQSITLTLADKAAGHIVVNVPAPAEGGSLSVTASIVDTAGNVSAPSADQAVLDTAATLAPEVSIVTDSNNDGQLGLTELLGETVVVRVAVPAGAQEGETLTLTGSTGTFVHLLTAGDLASGQWLATVPAPAAGTSLVVSATLTDLAGNVSSSGGDSALREALPAGGLGVEIVTDANNDGLLSPAEQGDSLTDLVKVILPVSARVGNLLHIDAGGTPIEVRLTVAQVEAGILFFDVPKPANGAVLLVVVTLTDAAGQVIPVGSDAARLMVLDLAAPGVRITTDGNDNGTIGAAERGTATQADLVITLPAGTQAGQLLTVSDNAGHVLSHTVTAEEQVSGLVALPAAFPLPAEGATLKVSATLADSFGNVSAPGTDTATLDTQASGAPGVEIVTDANNDGVLSRAEQGASLTDLVKITLPGDARVGDTLRIETGGTSIVRVLSVADVEGGPLFFDVPKPANGQTLTVTATLTDGGGNVSAPGSDAAMLLAEDLPAPTVRIVTDGNDDGVINTAERGAATQADLVVTLPAGAMLGQTLTVTDSAGHQLTHVLGTADLDAGTVGFPAAFALPAEGATLTVTAQLSDNYGNSSPVATDSASLDTTGPALTAELDPASDTGTPGDGITRDTTPTLRGTGEPGAHIQVSLPTGEVLHTTVGPDGRWTVTPLLPLPQGPALAQVLETDAVGNSVSASVPLVIDTVATVAPTVTIATDANNDGLISRAELAGAGSVAVQVGVPAGAQVGDTLTLVAGGATQTHVLTAGDLTAQVWATTVAVPAEGATLTATATLTDLAGNVSAPASDTAVLDTTASTAPVVTITTDANNDGSISAAEIGNATTVAIKVALAAGVVVGDTITLGGNVAAQTHVVTSADLAAGAWNTTVARPANGSTINATATLTDVAGNVSAPGSDSATLATVVCKASLVGDCGIYEGCAGTYKVQLDRAVTQDTVFYVQAQNGSATWVNHAAANQNIMWGGYYNTYSWTGWYWKENIVKVAAIGGDIPNAGKSYGADGTTTWDYSLNGGIATNLVAVTVRAGQTCSNSFTVNAWNETVSRDGDLNNTGYVEGTETFKLAITGSSNAAGITYGTQSLSVNIFDTTCYKLFSPIAIDLNGDGVKTTAIGETAGRFDLLGDGSQVVSGWLSGQDGFLAVDANHNGQIDSVNELFGGANGEALTKLAQYDSNGDGVVDQNDAQFQDLLVWQDANGDKLTQAGELISLTEAGIASLSTAFATDGSTDVAGNVHQAVGSVTFADGHGATMTDVYFNYAESDAALAAADLLATADTTIDLGALAAPAAGPTAVAAPVDLAALDLSWGNHVKVQLLDPHCTQAA